MCNCPSSSELGCVNTVKICCFLLSIVTVHVAAYKLFEVNMYRQRLRERRRHKEIGKGFSIMHNATTFGWHAYRTMWKKRTRDERFAIQYIDINYVPDTLCEICNVKNLLCTNVKKTWSRGAHSCYVLRVLWREKTVSFEVMFEGVKWSWDSDSSRYMDLWSSRGESMNSFW